MTSTKDSKEPENSYMKLQRMIAESRVREWQEYVKKNARKGESFEETEKRIIRERKIAEDLRKSGLPMGTPLKLPVWQERMRALPNGMLRSALFGAIGKGQRRALNAEPIAAIDGVSITYTGWRLNQSDLDVYEAVLHALRIYEMGEYCRITSYSLLKIMGKKDTGGGGNRDTLCAALMRLRANAVVLKQSKYTYIGGLLDSAIQNEDTKEWIISLNPVLRALFEPDQFTVFDWEVRRVLSGQPLAQWLHGFYASHAKPLPMKVGTLHKLCGSEIEKEFHFKEKLKKALDAVSEAYKITEKGYFNYEIEGGVVHIEKLPSKSQRRHLAKKSRLVGITYQPRRG